MSKPVFTREAIDKIANCLSDPEITDLGDHYRLKLINTEEKRQLSLEIYPRTSLGENAEGALVVVYTHNCHLQLHSCTGFITSDDLGEVTFISEAPGKISGLVVEREAACSIYDNVNRSLISDDFASFGVEVMLSGIALSLAEDILNDKED
jgi:hypothetical protein